jgi:hypothetical protein
MLDELRLGERSELARHGARSGRQPPRYLVRAEGAVLGQHIQNLE